MALTAWAGDRVTDADGFSLYLRDPDRGTVWSLGWQPVPGLPARYAVEHRPGVLAISRQDHGIEASLEVTVVPEADVELRVVRVWNRTNVARRLELTTCLEVVLHETAAHASHPAFSKLFVETAWDEAVGALLAHRRPRSSGERTGWMVHALAGPGPPERETDRARFVGRGRSLARPRALESMARLSGTVGNVLDPVLALRRTVELAPGAGATFVAALGAAAEADAALALAARWADADAAAAALALAGAHERARRARFGLDDPTAEGLQALAGALLYGHPALRAAALRIAGGVAPGPAGGGRAGRGPARARRRRRRSRGLRAAARAGGGHAVLVRPGARAVAAHRWTRSGARSARARGRRRPRPAARHGRARRARAALRAGSGGHRGVARRGRRRGGPRVPGAGGPSRGVRDGGRRSPRWRARAASPPTGASTGCASTRRARGLPCRG